MFRREAVITYPNGDYEASMNVLLESVDNEINSYIQRKTEIENLIFMSEATDETLAIFESEEKSFVGKLGQKIIDFFEMIKKKLQELSEKFKSLFKKKEDVSDAALKKAMENHPELAMSFYDGIRNGNIKIADYKDINSLLDTVEKLAKDMESGKIDHKTFSDKVDDALAAIEKKVKPVANILSAVTTITGAVTGLIFLKKQFIKQSHEYEDSFNKHNAKVNEVMKNMADGAETNREKATELSTLMKTWNRVSQCVFNHQSHILDGLEKITNVSVKFKNPVTKKDVTIGKKHTEKENIESLAKKGKFLDKDTRDRMDKAEKASIKEANLNDKNEKRLKKIVQQINLYGKDSLSDKDWAFYQIMKSNSDAKKIIGGNK